MFNILCFVILIILANCNSERIETILEDDLKFAEYNETLSPQINEDATVLSPCSISITWSCDQCTEVSNFIVYWNENEMQTVDNTVFTYKITELSAAMAYDIYVSAVYEDGIEYRSNPTVQSTEIGDPPDIDYLTVDDITDTRINLRWNTTYNECPVDYYSIIWNGIILCDGHKNDAGADTSIEEEFLIYGLTPYANYSVNVRAVSTDGTKGTASVITSLITEDGEPGPPESVASEFTSSTSIDISWEPPLECNGVILGYVVTWKLIQTDTTVGTMNSSETSVQIDDLKSCGYYEFSVRATTSAGEGESATITNTAGTEVPPPVTNLTSSDIASQSIQINWTPPDTLCPVIEYTIEGIGLILWNDTDDTLNLTVSGSETSFVIEDLIPWTDYTIYITAQTEGGISDSTSVDVQTLQDMASEPMNLLVQTLSTTEVALYWDPPELLNGDLKYYKVTWEAEATGLDYLFTNETEVYVTSLLPCFTYEMNVMGVNDAGDGDPATDNATLYSEAPPAPIITRCEALDPRTIVVEWETPDTTCPVWNYVLIAEGTNLWNGERTTSSGQTLELQFTLMEITPYTDYIISLTATTGGGSGRSSYCSQITDQDVPSEPTNLSLINLSSTEAKLKWDPPEMANGIITYYNVSWEAESVNKSFRTTSEREIEISGLMPCVIYEMNVVGATVVGEGEPATVNTSLTDEVPPPPIINKCEVVDSRTIEVEWVAVDSTCPIIIYEVIADGTILWDGTETVNTERTEDLNLTLSDLVPYTNYVLSVKAITIGNDGLSSYCSQTTDEDVPESPTDLTVIEDSITSSSFSITWKEPEVKNGNLRGFNVTLSNGFSEYVEYTRPNELLKMDFDNLESSTEYIIDVYAETGAGYGVPSEAVTETLSSLSLEKNSF